MTGPSERLVPLDGALNFRDLGGYQADSGRSTRWGCVFRSDGLDQLTDGDLDRLSRLGIRLVCDLRNDREVLDAPSRLPPTPTSATFATPSANTATTTPRCSNGSSPVTSASSALNRWPACT